MLELRNSCTDLYLLIQDVTITFHAFLLCRFRPEEYIPDLSDGLLPSPDVPPEVAGELPPDVVPVHHQVGVSVRPLLLVRHPQHVQQLVHHHFVVLHHSKQII